ncbi:MAG: hypothetical protein AMXMBFR13_41050 [Phycisphaerae bacterium]
MPVSTPPPAFVIATGDLTEYGVIGETWDQFEAYFEALDLPMYVVPGNHDNTWTSMTPIVRSRHGGDHYSFDQSGCHFVGIDTATIQEPVPSLEARTLNWLRRDLERVPAKVPVFVFGHHPLGTTEFATPMEQLRFLNALAKHNVVLYLMGHGHGVRAERWNGMDSVMGGSTFGPNTGYSIIFVQDGILRVVYRYREAEKGMKLLLEKPIARPELPEMRILEPAANAVVSRDRLPVKVLVGAGQDVVADVDGENESGAFGQHEIGIVHGGVSLKGLKPGVHYLRVRVKYDSDTLDRAVRFSYAPDGQPTSESLAELGAGVKARPTLVGGGVLVTTTGGEILRLEAESGRTGKQVRPLFETGVEIIHPPAIADETLYFSSAELGVFAAGLDGSLQWKRPVGAAVYGTPAVMGDTVYVGDLEGRVHAIERKSGRVKWSKPVAGFSIEMPILAFDGTLYLGAWDGYLYAVDAQTGTVAWKQRGPAGQHDDVKLRSRYYAPADCPPALVGDRLFVADRSYRLGSYSLDGDYLGEIAENVSAIAASADRRHFYARGLEKGLTKYDAEGKAVWTAPVPMGRFPCPPTEVGGRVYACSNRGLLSAVNAVDGKVLWQYQVSPQLHIMAPVAADAAGNVYVGGMDGSVVRVRGEDGETERKRDGERR